MAKTLPMSHNTDHRPAQKRPAESRHSPHTQPERHGPHIHHGPHAAHRADKSGEHAGLVSGILAVAAIAAAVAWYWLAPVREESDQPSEIFLHQMQQAAQGAAPASHAFGGPLNVVEKDGRLLVVAFGLPTKACVQAGWRLSKEGLIVVNGILPPRLSAAKLAELCSQNDSGSVLTWIPEPRNGAAAQPEPVR